MLEVSGGMPKELLMLGSKSVLHRVMEEARAADPDEIVVVTSADKHDLNQAVIDYAKAQFADIPIRLAFQTKLDGLAGAVHAAQVDSDAMVLVGDSVFIGGSPVERMSNLIYRGMDGCVAVREVRDSEVGLYGIVEVNQMNGAIERILEKPAPEATSSRWAVSGRFGLNRSLMAFTSHFVDRWTEPREVSLSDVFAAAIHEKLDLRAVPLQPDQERLDCGDPAGYERARRLKWD